MDQLLERFEAFVGVNPWTALFVLLNTLVIYFVGKKYLFGPVMKIISERQNEIDQLYLDANTARTDALALEAEYKEKLDQAMQTGDQLVKEAVQRGQRRQEEILRQANAEAAAMLDKATEEIAREKKKAINEAKDEISVIAVAIAEKVVCRELNEKDHADLVDSFINELGELE